MTCGHTRTVDGGLVLVCNLPPHTHGLHGIRLTPEVAPYVTWPDIWAPLPAVDWHEGWRKPHKRGTYETNAMWHARQP